MRGLVLGIVGKIELEEGLHLIELSVIQDCTAEVVMRSIAEMFMIRVETKKPERRHQRAVINESFVIFENDLN